jgi:hypothetical protein
MAHARGHPVLQAEKKIKTEAEEVEGDSIPQRALEKIEQIDAADLVVSILGFRGRRNLFVRDYVLECFLGSILRICIRSRLVFKATTQADSQNSICFGGRR